MSDESEAVWNNLRRMAERRERWSREGGRLFYLGVELPEGPWHEEGDGEAFDAHDFPCQILRSQLCNWCGYVGVPPEHPWFGRGIMKIDANVHGGVTYANLRNPTGAHDPIEPFWWVGFDTSHSGDLMLMSFSLSALLPNFPSAPDELSTYRTEAYARDQTVSLARQAAACAPVNAVVNSVK